MLSAQSKLPWQCIILPKEDWMSLDTLGRFSSIFYKGDNFCTSILLSCILSPYKQGSALKRKNGEQILYLPLGSKFFSKGSKFFPFRVDVFSEERKSLAGLHGFSRMCV